jgi:hypothetical protein
MIAPYALPHLVPVFSAVVGVVSLGVRKIEKSGGDVRLLSIGEQK